MLSLLQWVSKVRVVVCCNEQTDIISLVVLQEAALQRSVIPLRVVLSAQLGSALPQIVIAAAEQDDRVRVDVLLEFGLLGLFGIAGVFFLFFGDKLAVLVVLFRFLRRRRGLHEEHFESSVVAHWVAIKDIASVLAVILAQSPAECLAHELRGDLFLGGVLLVEICN